MANTFTIKRPEFDALVQTLGWDYERLARECGISEGYAADIINGHIKVVGTKFLAGFKVALKDFVADTDRFFEPTRTECATP